MSRRMKGLFIAVTLITVTIIVFQAITIHNTKKEQKLQFCTHIAAAAQSFVEYQETGYVFMYEDALMELHSASSIALLLEDNDPYKSIHGVLLSLIGTYHSSPNELMLFTDEIIAVFEDFSTHENVENLYTKLNSIDNQLTAMMMERAEKV